MEFTETCGMTGVTHTDKTPVTSYIKVARRDRLNYCVTVAHEYYHCATLSGKEDRAYRFGWGMAMEYTEGSYN